VRLKSGTRSGFKSEWAKLLPEIKRRLSALLSKSPSAIGPIDVAAILEQVASEVRDLHRFHFGFSDQVIFA
jgi:hypothetical protein